MAENNNDKEYINFNFGCFIDKLINEIDTSFIFFGLRNPLHDLIDVKGILEKVEKISVVNSTKDKLIEIMKINVSRYNG